MMTLTLFQGHNCVENKLHFKNKQTFFKDYFSQQFKRCMVATFKISYKIFV